MASSAELKPEDRVFDKDSLNSDNSSIDFYNDSEVDDTIDELDALLEGGSKADELDDILTDTSNCDFMVERRKELRNGVDETNKSPRSQRNTLSLEKSSSLNTRLPAIVGNIETFHLSATTRTRQKGGVDNDWKDRRVTIPKAPRLTTFEKNGERSYSTVSPAKVAIETVDTNWKDRQVTIPKAPRLATMEKNGERSYSVFSPAKEAVETVDTNWKDRQVTIPKAPRLATMEKNGERSYSIFTPAKEVVETVDNWKDRQVTIPKPPHLATMEKNGERSYSTVSPAKVVIETVDKWKDRQLTVPQSPRLATAKNGQKLYSCCVSKEVAEIPGIQSISSSYSKSADRKVTIPQSPRLMTMEKNGDRSYSCAASPMRGPNADYTAWTEYKEKLIEQGIFRESSPSARPLKLTIPSPFHLSAPSPKTKLDTKEISPKYEFKALPLPDFSFNETFEDHQKAATKPEPFDLLSPGRSRSKQRGDCPEHKERFRALPLNKHIFRSVSPSPRGRRASRQPKAKTEEHGENQENEPCNKPRTPRVPDHRYATPPTNVLFYSPSKNASEKNPPKTKISSPRIMKSPKSNSKSTTPRFKAKKMPDFSKPFVPQRRTKTSPMVKRVIPSPQPHQFKARKMPDFGKPFMPKKKSDSLSNAIRMKKQQNQVQTTSHPNKIDSPCQGEKEKTTLRQEQICEAAERNVVDSYVPCKPDKQETARESLQSHTLDNEKIKHEHETELNEVKKAAVEGKSNTQTPERCGMVIVSEEEILPEAAGTEERSKKEGTNDPFVNLSRENDISESKEDGTTQQINEMHDPLALVMERLNQSLQRFQAYEEAKARSHESEVLSTCTGIQEQKSRSFEDQPSLCDCDADSSHTSSNAAKSSEGTELKTSPQENQNQARLDDADFTKSDVTDLFRGGWHRAPDQGSLAEPNNGTETAIDTDATSYVRNTVAFEDESTPPSSLLQRRHFEDLVRADTPKTSNNHLGTIQGNNENTIQKEMESDNDSTRQMSLFNPSTEDSVCENDENSMKSLIDSLSIPNIDDTTSTHVGTEKDEHLETSLMHREAIEKREVETSKGEGSPLQPKAQRQVLVLSQVQNTDAKSSRPMQIVSERETKLLVKTKEQKLRKNVLEKLKNRKNAMKERNKRIKEEKVKAGKRSIGSVFDSQRFIYRFCCATGSRQPSPTRFMAENFDEEEDYTSRHSNTLDDGSMKDLKLVFK